MGKEARTDETARCPNSRKDVVAMHQNGKEGRDGLEGEYQGLNNGHEKFAISLSLLQGGAL